jgi:hypothetical protein
MTEPDAGRQAAARYLRELLLRPGRYRRQWEQHVLRARPEDINQLAVAEVLTRYLWSYPRRRRDADATPRQLKDTVRRALSGQLLSRPALMLFIDAFGIAADEADRLVRLWEGSLRASVLSGSRAMVAPAEDRVRAVLGPRRHQTVAMHDHASIGADRSPASTRTLQVIEAIVPGLDRVPYLYDTGAVVLELGQGCQGLSGGLTEIEPGVFATEILLARELDLGETITLEYRTSYRYPGNAEDPHERQYRRAVMRRLENFDVRVAFHPAALPARVWWAIWDGLDGEVADEELVSLDRQHAAQRYLRAIARTVVGFRWAW